MSPAAPTVPPHWASDWSVDPLWFEDDAFWERARPALFSSDHWRDAEAEVVQALALLGVTPPDRILDVACGSGRHLLALAAFGYRATGVDRTASFLAEARARAQAEGLEVQTYVADLRSLGHSLLPHSDVWTGHHQGGELGGFDGALWLGHSLGYSPVAAHDVDAAGSVATALNPGARLVIETLGLECALGEEREEVEQQRVQGEAWVIERRITDADWMEVRWGPADGRPSTYRHRLYSSTELTDILLQVGMRNVMICGDLDGRPYGPDSPALVAVAER